MAKTTAIFKLPPGKIPRRLQAFVKAGGKVFECQWCGVYCKDVEFCNVTHETLWQELTDGD